VVSPRCDSTAKDEDLKQLLEAMRRENAAADTRRQFQRSEDFLESMNVSRHASPPRNPYLLARGGLRWCRRYRLITMAHR